MAFKFIKEAWKAPVKCNVKLVLLALVDHADEADGECWPSIESISTKCGMSRSTVIVSVKKLKKLGLISTQKQSDAKGYRRATLYTLNLGQSPENQSRNIQHRKNQRRKNQSRNSESQSPESELSKVQNSDCNIIKLSLEPIKEPLTICEAKASPVAGNENKLIGAGNKVKCPPQVLEIFKHWQEVMEKSRAKLDKKRQQKIEDALKLGYSVEDLKAAINGCTRTGWNMGVNPNGKRYNDLELILRSAANIERFAEAALAPGNPGGPSGGHVTGGELFKGAL